MAVQQTVADSRLVGQALEGDDGAFSELVHRYQDALCHFLFHLTGGREDAEDLPPEVFVRAYLALPMVYDAAQFRAWLYRVASRLALS